MEEASTDPGGACVLGISPKDHRGEMAKLDSHNRRAPGWTCWGGIGTKTGPPTWTFYRNSSRDDESDSDNGGMQKCSWGKAVRIWSLIKCVKVRNGYLSCIQHCVQFHTDVSLPYWNRLNKISFAIFNKCLLWIFSLILQQATYMLWSEWGVRRKNVGLDPQRQDPGQKV